MEADAQSAADPRFQVNATDAGHFAWLGTRMALEMTMMAWIRMAITLVGFGFTIVKFFERLNDMEGVAPAAQPFAARYVGLVLIAAGVGALVVSALQYRATIRYLWQNDFAAIAGIGQAPGNTPIYAVTITLTIIGVAAFLAVLLRAV